MKNLSWEMKAARLVRRVRPIELGELLKRLLGISHGEHSIGELRLWLDPASNFGGRLLAEGNYEPEMTGGLRKILRPGDSFVDIGANEGWFSIVAAGCVGASGRVLAVEPQMRMWPVLLRNASLNNFLQIAIVPAAMGASPGEIEMALSPSLNPGASTFVIDRRRRHFDRQRVRVLSLDDLAARFQLERVRAVKIDVEGFEGEVIAGGGRFLREGIAEYLLIEWHPAQLRALGTDEGRLGQVLRSHGYVPCPGICAECWIRK